MRSLLFIPADSERKLAKALLSAADVLVLDLEDSVAPERKVEARVLARGYLQANSQRAALWVRVNDLGSGELPADLAAVMPGSPAGIVVPKVAGPEDLQTVARHLDDLEATHGIDAESVGMLAIVETPIAVMSINDILRQPMRRLKALAWGAEDLRSALGAGEPRTPDGIWRSPFEYARVQCLFAAKALGVEAIDTVYVDYRDAEGLSRACAESRADGFNGRIAIHPDQVSAINEGYSPTAADLELARRIVEAFGSGAGVVSIDGRMYDIPHLNAARRLIHSGS
jgi:citrate lyase subunit beta / citryl-CoA lyase